MSSTSSWTPVTGLLTFTALQQLRRAVHRLRDALSLPAILAPEFTIDPKNDWLAHDTEENTVRFFMPLTTIVRVASVSLDSNSRRWSEVKVIAMYDDTVGSLLTKIWKRFLPICLGVQGHRTSGLYGRPHQTTSGVCACALVQPQMPSHRFACVKWPEALWMTLGPDAAALTKTTRLQVTVLRVDDDNNEVKLHATGVNMVDKEGLLVQGARYVTLRSDCDDCSWGPVPQAVVSHEPSIVLEFSRFVCDESDPSPRSSGFVIQVQEAVALLFKWAPPGHPAAYLDLLDKKFPNEKVREFAVDQLQHVPDATFRWLLPQLVQSLKFEMHVLSPLAMTLIRRGLENPHLIGFDLFWLLKVEAYTSRYREHFGAILNAFVEVCLPRIRAQLQLQDKLFSVDGIFDHVRAKLMSVSKDGCTAMKEIAHSELSALNEILPCRFVLPIGSRFEVGNLVVNKCHIDGRSLLLVFENAEEGCEPISVTITMEVIYIIRQIDELSIRYGLQLCMDPYRCVPTSPTTGVIEVVRDGLSLRDVRKRDRVLANSRNMCMDWIVANTSDRKSRKVAEHRFQLSFAGYCLATWVLAIGNRSVYNIMLSATGKLFHTEMDMLLGRKKGWMARSPIYLPRDLVDVLQDAASREFKTFVDTCSAAYNVLKQHLSLLVSMLLPMTPLGAPEPSTRDDINGLIARLAPNLSEEEARVKMEETIYSSVGMAGIISRFDNAIHILPHVHDNDETEADGFLASKDIDVQSSVWNDQDLQRLRVQCNQVEQQKLLSTNGFSEVLQGCWRSRPVAIKRLQLKRWTMANAIVFTPNVKTAASFVHPNIVSIVGVAWEKAVEFQAISEYVECGDLRSFLDSSEAMSFTWAEFKCQVAIDIVDALQYLHSTTRSISVGALTSRKVLLTMSGKAKVSFLCASEKITDQKLRWAAPEVILGNAVSDRADIYTMGVLLCELDTPTCRITTPRTLMEPRWKTR